MIDRKEYIGQSAKLIYGNLCLGDGIWYLYLTYELGDIFPKICCGIISGGLLMTGVALFYCFIKNKQVDLSFLKGIYV